MVKFTNFCGIFATVFMVATAITIVSCSQDDDDYNSNMYTLAEEMETRSGGDPESGGGYTPTYNHIYYVGTENVLFAKQGSGIIRTIPVEIYALANNTYTSFGVKAVLQGANTDSLQSATVNVESSDTVQVSLTFSFTIKDGYGQIWNGGWNESCKYSSFL